MIIKGMSFLNYKKFKEPTELSLEEFSGRIGILGNNGSGKSTLLDVIPIALYGVEALTGKKEHLRTQGLEKDLVKLRLDFEHGGKHFIVEREFKGANLTPAASIFESVLEVPHLLATSAKAVTEYVEKSVLNMDYSTFIATVFCKQKELNRISSMLPTERKAFVLKLSKVDDIDDDIKKCRELKRDSEKLVNLLMDEVSSKENVLTQIDKLDEDIKALKTEHKGALSKLKKYEAEYIEANDIKKVYDEKYEQYHDLTIKVTECKNTAANIDNEINKLQKEQAELVELEAYLKSDGYPLIEKQKEVQAKLNELDNIRPMYLEKNQLIANINKAKAEGVNAKSVAEKLYTEAKSLNFDKKAIPKLEEEILSLEKEIDDLKNVRLSKSSELNSISAKIKECKNEIQKISALRSNSSDDDCKCPMCKQVVSKEYSDIVEKHYTDEISKLDVEAKNLSSEVKALEDSLKEKTSSLNIKKSEIQKIKVVQESYNDIVAKCNAEKQQYQNKIAEYKSLVEKYKQYEHITFEENMYKELKNEKDSNENTLKKVHIAIDKVSKLPQNKENLVNMLAKKEEVKIQYQGIVEEGKALNYKKDEHLKIKAKSEECAKKYSDFKEESSTLITQITAKDVNERKLLMDRLSNIKKKESEYNKHRDLANKFTTIEEALRNTKNEIMANINPLINKHFSDLFKTLMNEKYDDVELDENYNILIYDNGEAIPLSRFSGGEQDLCNLALRLAVSKYLAEANSGCFEFIVLDEIFASLDDEKKSSLIEVLGNLEEFFKQIFIISHEDVIKSSLDHYITVKENSHRYSEIEF